MPDNVVGRAVVEVEADTGGLKKGLGEARAATQKFSADTESGLKKTGEAFDKNTEGVRKLSGALTSTVGVATGLAGALLAAIKAVEELQKKLEDGAKASEDLTATFIEGGKEAERLAQVRERLAQAEAELTERTNGGVRDSIDNVLELAQAWNGLDKVLGGTVTVFGRSTEQIKEEIDSLIKKEKELEDQVRARRKASERAAKDAEAATEGLRAIAFLLNTTQKASNKLLEDGVKAANELADARERERKELEQIERITQSIADRSSGLFGETGSAAALQAIARNLERLGGPNR